MQRIRTMIHRWRVRRAMRYEVARYQVRSIPRGWKNPQNSRYATRNGGVNS